ncbi:hypothetical protein [Endozoicomonas sp. 4G]|uniref:hypothetical protein n=1 Tax=Endozoicomonas sp. 4G TaxID=2872754 RepID=UPI00207865E6|nr:hypothetical protein [Endozoicomonas sp. 4G]
MKNQKSIIIARIIFVLSVFCSYNANASVYKAMDSLVSLVNEIGVKQKQLEPEVATLFSGLEFQENLSFLRFYHASLLARQQPDMPASSDVFLKLVRKQARRQGSKDKDFAERAVQDCVRMMSVGRGVASAPFDNEVTFTVPQFDLFNEGDKLEDEQVSEAAKDFLSKLYEILVKDEVFLATCTNLDLAKEYEETMNLIRAALQ